MSSIYRNSALGSSAEKNDRQFDVRIEQPTQGIFDRPTDSASAFSSTGSGPAFGAFGQHGAAAGHEFKFGPVASAAANEAPVQPSGGAQPLFSSIPDNISTTATIALDRSVYGNLSLNDSDWYRIQLTAGQTYEFRYHGVGVNQLEDPLLNLFNSAGTLIATNDDNSSWSGGNPRDSRIVFTASSSGTYFVGASSFNNAYSGNYLLTATTANSSGMVFTTDEIAWQISNNFQERSSNTVGAFNVGGDSALSVNLTALDSIGQTLCRQALRAWTDITGIAFTEISGAAEITFDDTDPGGDAVTAYANTSVTNGVITSASVILTQGWITQFGSTFGSYSFETYIHEIGHALGLGHGGNYNGSATYGVDNYYLNDSVAYTIMSYMNAYNDEFSGPNTFVDASFRFMQTAAIADIIAIQNLYGDHSNTRTGNTTYGFNANTGNAALDAAVGLGASMFFTVYDDGGVDTLDFSGANVAQRIDLREESFSNVLGGISNVSVARGAIIENAIGGSASDVIIGNAAANLLDGRGGADNLNGGAGNDTYIVDNAGDAIVEGAGGGADTVFTVLTYALGGAAQVETLRTANGGGVGAINLTGNGFVQTIIGNAGVNIIDGGGGADTLQGLNGNDSYIVDNAGDVIIEGAGGGTDTVFASLTYALGAAAQVEALRTTNGSGLTAINLNGNGFVQTIIGNNGVNRLDGGGGADTLQGLNGNDTYIVDNAGDVIIEGAGGGTADVVFTGVSYSLGAAAQIETLRTTNGSGLTAINLTGNGFVQTLVGNAGANRIDGGAGADTLQGLAGNDTYIVDNAGDVIVEGSGEGTGDVAFVGLSYALGAAAQVETLRTTNGGGLSAINLTGNGFVQAIIGNSGNNRIDGKGGADALQGLGGNDTFVFSSALNLGVDTISDFSVPSDTIELKQAIFTAAGAIGVLNVNAFFASAAGVAHDLSDRIIYDTDSGALFYDADGNAAGAAVQFATLTTGLALTNADFLVA